MQHQPPGQRQIDYYGPCYLVAIDPRGHTLYKCAEPTTAEAIDRYYMVEPGGNVRRWDRPAPGPGGHDPHTPPGGGNKWHWLYLGEYWEWWDRKYGGER